MTTLRGYRDEIEAEVCPHCRSVLPYWIERRDHSYGFAVAGFYELQWLFITCLSCKVEISCTTLGLQLFNDAEDD